MNNSILLGYVVNILPKLTLVFVSFVLLYKIFFKIRSRYSVTVNCWFCNENSKVPYSEKNSWTCIKCDQYNGFNKDGDYNREIRQQFDCSSNSNAGNSSRTMNHINWFNEPTQNGFCDACNEAQRLKVEKLSQFEPKKESRFDQELEVYKTQLEEQYRLCATCDRHLKAVLRTKKKMVLGSKFLEYFIKGAEALKQPQYNIMRKAKQELWKRRLAVTIAVMTAINLCCLFGSLPSLNRAWFTENFGVSVGLQLFIICSHLVAFWRVLTSYLISMMDGEIFVRLGLFTRTIFMMLLYSLGLKLPELVRLNFISLYMLIAPFCILATIFSYNVIDRFKLTRFTLLLVLWSLCAGGIVEQNFYAIQQSLLFITSLVTCLLASTSKFQSSPKLYDRNANSFHKIFADDYASDEETIESSGMSRQLDCSSMSTRSDISRSFANLRPYKNKSPLSSSTFSLHHAPQSLSQNNFQMYDKDLPTSASTLSFAPRFPQQQQQQHPLNTSFKSSYAESNHTLRSGFSNSTYNLKDSAQHNFVANSLHSFRTVHPPRQSPFINSNVNRLDNEINNLRNNSFAEFPTPGETNQNANVSSTSTLHNPFLNKTFTVNNNNPERPSRVLSPSRFAFNSFTTAFVGSNNNFAEPLQYTPNHQPYKSMAGTNLFGNYLSERRNGTGSLGEINEDLSRASSRSSGFESQNGHLNNSRENSCCPDDSNDLNRRNLMVDNARSFQPLENYTFNRIAQPSMLSPHSGSVAPSLNSTICSSEWHTGNRSQTMSRDTFNLRGINQGLPNIKRGDLLRKWKEGGVVN